MLVQGPPAAAAPGAAPGSPRRPRANWLADDRDVRSCADARPERTGRPVGRGSGFARAAIATVLLALALAYRIEHPAGAARHRRRWCSASARSFGCSRPGWCWPGRGRSSGWNCCPVPSGRWICVLPAGLAARRWSTRRSRADGRDATGQRRRLPDRRRRRGPAGRDADLADQSTVTVLPGRDTCARRRCGRLFLAGAGAGGRRSTGRFPGASARAAARVDAGTAQDGRARRSAAPWCAGVKRDCPPCDRLPAPVWAWR